MIKTRFTEMFGVEHPIVQEGLGPYRTSKLAAAVSQAGGLGTVSMPGMPEDLREGARTFRAHIDECASLTDKPFAVNIPVGVDAHGQVVATVFPFTANAVRQPPHRGVIEEDRLDAPLQHIHDEVVATDVRQLVREHGQQMLLAETGECRERQQHDRPQPADDDW
jgi:NAD(P)H-dependent flavin oxidoreductase YrpB (nitropropane dioxygenase family)